MSQPTAEQQQILTHVSSMTGLTLIDSVAGSGKTTMLIAIAKAIPHTNGLYMAYNKAIATEASRKFPKTTICSTTHSLAYQAVFKAHNLLLGDFTYRSILEKLSYDHKLLVVDAIREYCLSRFIRFEDYCTDTEQPAFVKSLGSSYLDKMHKGKIECTHEFYLKLFHILLDSGDIEYDPFDFIMLDEVGDINEVTLEIFKLLPSERKIAVGDPFQNIYTFNHTINCFKVLEGQGTLFRMSKSFRVADYIAPRIEKFCRIYLDPNMSFQGVPVSSTAIRNSLYITRTNAALINRMIELNAQRKSYGLVRKASEIFKMPLMLCSLKHKGFITDPAYKFLQADVDDWYDYDNIRIQFASPIAYLAHLHKEDFPLQQATRLVLRYGKATIMQAFNEAKRHKRSNQSYILATAHSCKGLEADEVYIADDMNESISDTLIQLNLGRALDSLTTTEQESLNLYYVACSRAAIQLHNATHL